MAVLPYPLFVTSPSLMPPTTTAYQINADDLCFVLIVLAQEERKRISSLATKHIPIAAIAEDERRTFPILAAFLFSDF